MVSAEVFVVNSPLNCHNTFIYSAFRIHMENTIQLGFTGVGNIGTPMRRHLIEAGHTIVAYDVCEANLSRIVNLGAQAADSLKAVAQACEVVFSSLPGSREVEQVILGKTALTRRPSPRDRRQYRLASADAPKRQNEDEIRRPRSMADAAPRYIIAPHLLALN